MYWLSSTGTCTTNVPNEHCTLCQQMCGILGGGAGLTKYKTKSGISFIII